MGGLLYLRKGKRNPNTVQAIILRTIAGSGQLALNALLPKAFSKFGPSFGISRKTDPRYDVPRGVRRLIGRGYLRVGKYRGEEVLVLTKNGEALLRKITYAGLTLKQPKKWDGKWRMVIYDIKEDRKHLRRALKRVLENVGFILVQKSVWVYPYPCENLLAILKGDFQVGKEVLYLVVDHLENDAWVRQHFKLAGKK